MQIYSVINIISHILYTVSHGYSPVISCLDTVETLEFGQFMKISECGCNRNGKNLLQD